MQGTGLSQCSWMGGAEVGGDVGFYGHRNATLTPFVPAWEKQSADCLRFPDLPFSEITTACQI